MKPASRSRALAAAALASALASAPAAHAGPWMREPGHFYISLAYQGLSAERLYGGSLEVVPISGLRIHTLTFYGEIGAIPRWLNISIDGDLFRHTEAVGQAYTQGMGDLRLGFWTGLLQSRVRLAAALLLGVPSGDPEPDAQSSDLETQHLARSLPTGDGEVDVEARLSFGTSFGRARYWPLEHYLVAELGYRVRTRGFADDLPYRLELGTKIPVRVLDRIWLITRLFGVESLASSEEALYGTGLGIGNGVTYLVMNGELQARVYRGLGLFGGVLYPLRGRWVPDALQGKAGLSYEF
jgi:hypothetical protein